MIQKSEIIKVAFVIPNLKRGGAEKVLVHLVNNIDYKIFEPIIFCQQKEGELLSSINKEVTVVDLQSPRVYFIYKALTTAIKKYNPAILVGWMGHINAMLAFHKHRFPKSLIVCCRESSIPSRFISHYKFPGLFRWLYKKLNRLDGVICQSDAMSNDLQTHFQVAANKIKIISNPVAIANTGVLPAAADKFANSAEKLLLFVGRFSKEKMPRTCADVIQLLPEAFKLIMVGYGPLTNELEQYIHQKKSGSRILLVTDCTDPAGYYQRANCFLMTSAFEGFPNVLLEANSHGCPVVVYGTEGGAKEVVQEYNGIYIPPGEGEGLSSFASAIQKVCSGAVAADKVKIAKLTNDKYGMNFIIKQYETYFLRLTSKNN